MGQVSRDLAKAIQENQATLDASPNLKESLLSLLRPILDRHYRAYLPMQGVPSMPPLTDTLACGITADGEPWIHEIDRQCLLTDYEERGFHAIGSAAAFAQLANALVAHFDVRNRPLDHAKVVAYRVMDIAISTSAYGVGHPVKMWQITEDGAQQLTDDEISEIKDSVGGWQEHEKSSLDQHMAGGEEAADLDEELPPDSS